MWSHISVSKSPSSPTWTCPPASSSSPPAGSWNHIPLLPVISWWITVNSLPLSPTLRLSFSFPLQSYGGFLFLQWIHSFCFYCTAHSHFLFSVFFPVYIPLSCLFRGESKSKEWRKYHFTISVSPHSTVQKTSVLLTPSPVQPNHLHNFIYYNFILKTNLWSSCRELVVNTPLNNCNWWMFLVEAAFWKF